MIEENHNLIYSYCHNKNLDVNEYYGLLAETMCKVIPRYDGSSNLSTYLYTCFTNAIRDDWRKNKNNKLGYDENIEQEDYSQRIENIIISNELIEKYGNDIIKLYIQGYTIRELSDMFNIPKTNVSKIISKFRLEVERYYRK